VQAIDTPGDTPLDARLAEVVGAFKRHAGREPDGVWFAPGRVNLIGEHTDYSDGFVLPLAIDRGVVAVAARRDDGRLRLWSSQQPGEDLQTKADAVGPGTVEGWAAYPGGVVWALRQAGAAIGGVDLLVDGDVPAGAGLSSSAALECAAAVALADLYGDSGAPGDPKELARLARRAENEVAGMPCGVMDQMVSMLGQAGHALFLDTRTLETEQIPLELDTAGLRLLVIDTRAVHQHVSSGYAKRRAAVEAATRTLGVAALRDATAEQVEAAADALGDPGVRRARHVVSENARVLAAVEALREGDFQRLGPLLVASHASMRDDFEISCPELDTAVDAALEAGAVGARMTGGGFGGSAIALTPLDREAAVAERVRKAFAEAAFTAPEILAVRPGDGAHRLA
jgi:galactokinase